MPSPEPLLLDTHVWIWFAVGNRKQISRQSWAAIERACHAGTCWVSIISVWEIGMLAAKGRLNLKLSATEWAKQALQIPGVSLIPISCEVAIESSYLPGPFYGDPADRILAATARELRARLATADEKLLDYGRRKHLNTLIC